MNPGDIVNSLTNTGRDVVQAGLQSAAPIFLIVCNVGLQVGNTKLPLIHHAYQAASSLTGSLSCHHKMGQCGVYMHFSTVISNYLLNVAWISLEMF